MTNHEITIIGAGLTGLSLGYFLQQEKIPFQIIEARSRSGGRIKTLYKEDLTLEMGATWLGNKHTSLLRLLKELGIAIHEQKMGQYAIYEPISTSPHQIVTLPPQPDPSYRIKGGSSQLISYLKNHLPDEALHLNEMLLSVTEEEYHLILKTTKNTIHTNRLISTLPPNLLLSTVDFTPDLPEDIVEIASSTHTWMGESIKVALSYDRPFWWDGHHSGTIVSNVGPIPEMYDHSNYEETSYALKGFINGDYYSKNKQERKELVIDQLTKYFGPTAKKYKQYFEKVWRDERYTYHPYQSNVYPHQNNGHHIYRKGFLNEKLFIAGSETSASFPGYMEGAVTSAQEIFRKLIKIL